MFKFLSVTCENLSAQNMNTHYHYIVESELTIQVTAQERKKKNKDLTG